MLFMVGVERPQCDGEAFGIIVPVFELLGYGCISAADTREAVLYSAKDAILEVAEEMLQGGHALDALDTGYQDLSRDYPDYDEWFALEVPVESLKGKQKRVNVTLSEPLLARIDAYVESRKSDYKDRSDFLAKAADTVMQQNKTT
ncbi:hypothetical protein CWB99_07130 [Pseudoalteromonas rubra]|uniref:HicB-like antitoxin of toxin-antitoxin system domain-containing protein n=1 Tax=Pseudoalteromonas rubra TaxID=43658 RepID=A0A5S3WNL1_9GAMM|nr:type II toxin-antitoxin system HicB family antitoxin [Pseudoalteromonas rubra]TMP28667.1 hypothetical protein CWC00_20925 [Pseudoalteromonas rubra]TMP29853.1 hypothetical protein CWB99_07130 [Pseudoalteromonas rubra]